RQFNFEFRAADAAANPHLVLATLVRAGLQGVRERLTAPEPTREDLSLLSERTLSERGLVPLPKSLERALEFLQADPVVGSWFADGFLPIYLAHKRGELAVIREKSQDEILAAYADAY